jgi:Cu(I)/Ag(I) efflux system membrane fusion protein
LKKVNNGHTEFLILFQEAIMKKTSVILILAACLVACQPQSSQQQADDETDNVELPAPTRVKPEFEAHTQLDEALKGYLAVKDSFVKSDTAAVNQGVADLQTKIAAVTGTALAPEAQAKWTNLQAMLQRTTTTLRAVPGLEEKRAAFEDLSKLMYEVVTTFGAGETVYKQYCPMALDDKGAYWLSLNSEIRNPYFGDKMLECGEVQEVLTFEK